MPTPADVKLASLTGEFNLLDAGAIQPFLDEAAEHYRSLPARRVRQSVVDRLTVLHAAHRLHQALVMESGPDNGGGGGQSGPVKSATLARVGSWTFGGGAAEQNAAGEHTPIPDWETSPYGLRWRGLWQGVTPPCATTGRAAW